MPSETSVFLLSKGELTGVIKMIQQKSYLDIMI